MLKHVPYWPLQLVAACAAFAPKVNRTTAKIAAMQSLIMLSPSRAIRDAPEAYSSSTIRPSLIVTRRSMRAASSMLWVAMMVARPEARMS